MLSTFFQLNFQIKSCTLVQTEIHLPPNSHIVYSHVLKGYCKQHHYFLRISSAVKKKTQKYAFLCEFVRILQVILRGRPARIKNNLIQLNLTVKHRHNTISYLLVQIFYFVIHYIVFFSETLNEFRDSVINRCVSSLMCKKVFVRLPYQEPHAYSTHSSREIFLCNKFN